jgi:hypothetical protein
MTLKEELDEQRRRLEQAQKQYFANQGKPDGGRDESFGGVVSIPGIAILKGFKLYGGGEVTGPDKPEYRIHPDIVRFPRQNFYGGGEVTKNSAPRASSEGTELPLDSDAQEEVRLQECELKASIFRFRGATVGNTKSCPKPPINAEFILHLLLRHDEHDALIGDLIERYGRKSARLGVRRANLWFYAEILWTALPLLKRALVKASGLVAFGEWVRRHVL